MKKFKGLDGILLIDDDKPTNLIHARVIEKSNIAVVVKAITSVAEALDFLTIVVNMKVRKGHLSRALFFRY